MDINLFTDPSYVIVFTMKIFLVSSLIRILEFFFIRKEFRDGIYAWDILKIRFLPRFGFIFRNLDWLFEYRTFFFLLVVSAVCSIALFFIEHTGLQLLLFSFVFVVNLLITYRNRIGWDGSDSLSNILNAAIFISLAFAGIDGVQEAGIIFIAAQLLQGYFISGILKLRAKEWTRGTAVYRVANTIAFGSAHAANLLFRLGKRANLVLCIGICLWEVLFFVSLFLPLNIFLIFLLSGFLFHLLNAAVMGLNRFLITFTAGYPSLICVKLVFFS